MSGRYETTFFDSTPGFLPFINRYPEEGFSKSFASFIRVVFPLPLGPRSPIIFPLPRERLMLLRAFSYP